MLVLARVIAFVRLYARARGGEVSGRQEVRLQLEGGRREDEVLRHDSELVQHEVVLRLDVRYEQLRRRRLERVERLRVSADSRAVVRLGGFRFVGEGRGETELELSEGEAFYVSIKAHP